MGIAIYSDNEGFGDWCYAYGTFARIRDVIRDITSITQADIEKHFAKGLNGYWYEDDEVEDDIMFLLSHRDEGGIFMPWTSAAIGKRMTEILLHNREAFGGNYDWAVELCDLFVKAGDEDYSVILRVG